MLLRTSKHVRQTFYQVVVVHIYGEVEKTQEECVRNHLSLNNAQLVSNLSAIRPHFMDQVGMFLHAAVKGTDRVKAVRRGAHFTRIRRRPSLSAKASDTIAALPRNRYWRRQPTPRRLANICRNCDNGDRPRCPRRGLSQ